MIEVSCISTLICDMKFSIDYDDVVSQSQEGYEM